MRRVGLVVLVAGLLIPAGCTGQKDVFVTQAGDPSRRISVKQGEDFTLTLPSNRTTGYSWRMGELSPGVVQLLDHVYRQAADTPALVGAGGEERWTFKAVGAGQVTLRFEYVRPWEAGVPAIRKAEFVVTSTR